MRLTLRTLLAYLDDVLPPDQAKEMGQKLTDSSYATALVDRIRDVMRRRRLTAPELSGPAVGIEPNVVAEYLDNELAPNNIADVEKICLDSDVHLAEVAACHQILTLVLGEPVDVRPETRARMYALGPVATSDKMKANDGPSSISLGSEHQPFPSISSALNSQDTGSMERTLPDYLKRKTSWRRTGLLVVLLLVAVGWISLVMRDPTLLSGLTSGRRSAVESTRDASISGASRDAARQKPSGVAALVEDRRLENSDNVATPTAQDEAVVAAAETANEKNVKIGAKLPKELPSDDDKPDDAAKVGLANRDKPSNNESSRTEVANADKSKPAATASEENVAASKKVEVALLPPLKLLTLSKEGILLNFVAAAGDFMVLPRRAELKPDDRLVCPEPFRADIAVGDDLCQVALIGGTAVTCVGPSEHASFGFDIQQGSILFEAKGLPRPAADADKVDSGKTGLAIAILLRGRLCHLELVSDDALCGIEVHRREPNHFEHEPDPPGISAALHVARGTVRFRDTDGEVTTVEGPGFMPITADIAANLKNSEIGRPSQLILPDWLEADPKRAAAKQKRLYNVTFEKEFDVEQPLLLSVPAIVNNPRPAIAELAVKCLGLTDSYAPLVKTLVQVEHREARLASIAALRQWLPLDPKNRQLLKVELGRHFLPSDADAVYRLLWGFNHDDAKNPAKSQMLVGWLEHEQIAIRELAFWHVQRLTGLKHDYSPINPPGQRRVAVERWRTHLEKKGGALIQE